MRAFGRLLLQCLLPLICLLAFAGMVVLPVVAQQPAITSFQPDGTLTWTNVCTNCEAAVEKLSEATTGQWAMVYSEQATALVSSVEMDMTDAWAWFRVVNTTESDTPAGMVLIPGGTNSGTNPLASGESYSDGSYPATYSLTVGAFYMDRHEVTKALWDEVATWAASHGYDISTVGGSGKAPDHPVQVVTWYRCVKWCNARSEMENLTPAYYTSADTTTVYRTGLLDVQDDWMRWDTGYRLPTSEEWEYAARGGAVSRRFPWGGDTISHDDANYRSYWEDGAPYYPYDYATESGWHPSYISGGTPYTSPVGSFAANAYGLFDMAGNVFEWCNDWHPDHVDVSRVLRGGSWSYITMYCRVGQSLPNDPGNNNNNIGFRTVRPLSQ
jgi:formylglycine-generating enzyme required for sulfatase activity